MKHAVPDHLSLFWREVCEQDWHVGQVYPCRIDLYTYQVIAVLVYRCVCYDYCSSTVRRCTYVTITVPWLYVGVHVLWLLFLDCTSVYIRYYYCSLTVCRCTCVMITVPWLYAGVHTLWLLFLDCMSVYIRYYYCSSTVHRCTYVIITVPWLYVGVHTLLLLFLDCTSVYMCFVLRASCSGRK